jgi:hypothetical protein
VVAGDRIVATALERGHAGGQACSLDVVDGPELFLELG